MRKNITAFVLITMVLHGVNAVSDNFTGTSINGYIWENISGDWIQNNTLRGYWDSGYACGFHARIHLVTALQPLDNYRMSVDFLNGHGGFSVGYLDDEHVLNINIDNGGSPYAFSLRESREQVVTVWWR